MRRFPTRVQAPLTPLTSWSFPTALSLRHMRAVQITRFGGPEVLDVVELPDPVPGEGQPLYDVSAAGINFARHPPLTEHSTD